MTAAWLWPALAWGVPGAPDVRYAFDAPPPVPDVASGSADLDVVGCTVGGSSFHPAFGTVLECPSAGAANAAPYTAALETYDRFTVAAWVNVPDPLACPNQRCTVVQQGNTDASPLGFYVYTRLGVLRFTLHDGVGEEFVEAGPLPAGRWAHVTARQDGHEASLFVDGVRQATATLAMTPTHQVGAPLNVGHTAARDFDLVGSLDELLLWRRPLSDAEIAELVAWYADDDADGWTGDDDCDDADQAVHPGAQDLTSDGVDQDCSGVDGPGGDTGATPVETGPTPGDTGRTPGDTGRAPGDTGPGATTTDGGPEDTAPPPPGAPGATVLGSGGVDPGCTCHSARGGPAWLALLLLVAGRRFGPRPPRE